MLFPGTPKPHGLRLCNCAKDELHSTPLALLSILINRRVMTRVEGTASTNISKRYKFSKRTYIHCGEPHIQFA